MSYLAIARKYRPATFDEIVGQEHVTRTLRNAILHERIHHAYLFSGARGVGKTTAARALAKALNCEQGPTPDPCGTCPSCIEVVQGSSPDLIEIDGASNNGVDDIRDLRDTVAYAPTRGGYKIYLVDEVHMLSKAAFNALLKTLEEPPPHVVFIFATTEPNKILDTILSRVQRFDFKRISIPALVDRLGTIATAEGVTLSEQGLRMVARAGEGSMRDAQSLLDKVISFGGANDGPLDDAAVAETLGLIDRSILFDFVGGLVQGDPGICLEAIARVYDYGHELSQFTADLLEILRNATFVALSESARAHLDVGEDELARLTAVAEGVPAEQLTRAFNALLDVHDKVSRASRPRIVLEMAAIQLATTRPVQPVSELLSRLEQLERRVRPRGGTPPPSGSDRPRSAPRATPQAAPRAAARASGSASKGRAKASPASESPPEPDPGPPEGPTDRVRSAPTTSTRGPSGSADRRAPITDRRTAPPIVPAAPVAAASVATASVAGMSSPSPTISPEPRGDPPAATPQPEPVAATTEVPAGERPADHARPTAPTRPTDPAPPNGRSRGERNGSSGPPSRDTMGGPPEPPFPEDPGPPPAFDDGGGVPTFAERWAGLAGALREIGGAVGRLADLQPTIRNERLVFQVAAGRALAAARRAQATPAAQGALGRYFPGLRFEAGPLPGTGTAAEHDKALQREVLEDPTFQRIIQTLDATLDAVTSLRDDAN